MFIIIIITIITCVDVFVLVREWVHRTRSASNTHA